MNWFKRSQPSIKAPAQKSSVPDGLWLKCKKCQTVLYRKEVESNLHVCQNCNFHMRVNSGVYRDIIFDKGSFQEIGTTLKSKDFLEFRDTEAYHKRIVHYSKRTGMNDAVLSGHGTINGLPVAAALMDFFHFGGSVGSVVGEKIALAIRLAIKEKMPLLILSASGGMRMQEGTTSLMQMAKVSALLTRLAKNQLPFISLLTDPTTGGTSASFAMLGDAIIAEPGALIGFAGPRVIKQTIGEDLPAGFQRSEFLLEHGFLDRIVARNELKECLEQMFRLFLGMPARESID